MDNDLPLRKIKRKIKKDTHGVLHLIRKLAGAKKDSVCIGGYAGCGNIGDDAILQGYLKKLLQEKSPCYASRITVLTGKPKQDRRRFGVRCINRRNPFAVIASFLRSEQFLCGGGSLLQNTTGTLSLLYYLTLLRLAAFCGCRVSLFAAGIGPLNGRFAEKQTFAAMRICEKTEVRDTDSYRLLLSAGIDREKLKLVPDPAFFLEPPPPSRLGYLLLEAKIPYGKKYFCIAVREADKAEHTLLRSVTAAVRLFSVKHQMLPVFLEFDKKNDGYITEKICRKTNGRIIRLREASDAIAMLTGSEFLIGMRLHALIFSVIAGTPAIGISPSEQEPKMNTFCRSAAMEHLYPSDVTIIDLCEKLEYLLANGDKLRAILPAIARDLSDEKTLTGTL